ncbi:MAG: penicillin-binding protein [Candidatus Omnitrophica bacterium]|nr:penicillin-binding protein [Candidatus Omnitrophota bacterium]
MNSAVSPNRIRLLTYLIFGLFALIAFQLVILAWIRQDELAGIAKRQHNLVIEIQPKRGLIYDSNLKELATSLRVPSIYAVPRLMGNKERFIVAKQLSQILGLNYSDLVKRFSKKKSFVWLKRRVKDEQGEAVKKLKNPNVGVVPEYKRFYPNTSLMANLMGFCGIDNNGLEGLELKFDSYLKGKTGYRYTKRDAMGREIVAMEEKLIPAVNGYHLVLTIDQYIQYLTEKELNAACTQWNAKGGMAIVMNPNDGAILSMASWPTYDPNHLKDYPSANRRNRAITDFFEPGSIFKIVTVTGALNEGAVHIEDKFDCMHGIWQIGRRTLHDVHPYGILDLQEVLIKSSNIGTVKVAARLGAQKLYYYIKQFGFGAISGIELPGEVVGIVRPPSQWSGTSMASIPYGQEVAATAIQCLSALNVIANGGTYYKPHILNKIIDDKGIEIVTTKLGVKKNIVKPEVAASMRRILERVVEEGTGKTSQIEGIPVAGKTGTAQKILPTGGYSHSNFVASFIGFAPVDKPLVSMIVVLDDPHPSYYGGTVAGPVFKKVIEQALLYKGYRPQNTIQTKKTVQKSRHE